jgi:hypothetical protein
VSERDRGTIIGAFGLLFFVLFLVLTLPACTGTISPKAAVQNTPTPSATGEDSGIVGAKTPRGWPVNDQWVNRYNGLLDAGWGKHFIPAVTTNRGVSPAGAGLWYADDRAIYHKAMIESWLRAGLTP